MKALNAYLLSYEDQSPRLGTSQDNKQTGKHENLPITFTHGRAMCIVLAIF